MKGPTLKEELVNNSFIIARWSYENDEIIYQIENATKIHDDEVCPHLKSLEDIQYKATMMINELDSRMKTISNIRSQALICKADLCVQLERNIKESMRNLEFGISRFPIRLKEMDDKVKF